jgi:tRNA pseudouridine55 synthase
VECSAGTYVRSLAHDLGRALGVGAHLHDLCRTRSGPFSLEGAVKLDELAERGPECVRPMAVATGLPTYAIDARLARRIVQGVQLGRHEVRGAPAQGVVQLVHGGRLVALAELFEGLPQLRTLRVFLEGTRG